MKGKFMEDVDTSCKCTSCEENKDGKCRKINSRFIDYSNRDLGIEYYYPFCDYRNQPELREAYDDGFDDGYRAAY